MSQPVWRGGYAFVFEDENMIARIADPPTRVFATPSRQVSTWTYHQLWQRAELNTGAYHRASLVLHVLNVVLVALLAWQLTGSKIATGSAAAMFGWHPLQTEAVGYITALPDLLGTAGIVLAVCWSLWRVSCWWLRPLQLGLCGGALLIAMNSKEAAVVAPVLVLWTLMVWRWTPQGIGPRSLPPWLAGVLLLGAGGLVWRDGWRLAPLLHASWDRVWDVVRLQSTAIVRLLLLVPYPTGQSVDHDIVAVPMMAQWISVVLLGVTPALVIAWMRRRPMLAWALGWVLINALPRFVLDVPDLLTEHHVYVWMPALSIAVGSGLTRLVGMDDKLWRARWRLLDESSGARWRSSCWR